MTTIDLQQLEYTLLSAQREAMAEAHGAPKTKGLLPPFRAAEALEAAANAVRDWREATKQNHEQAVS